MNRIVVLIMMISSSVISAQEIIDEVFAVVGDNIIMKSEIETQYSQAVSQGFTPGEGTKCEIKESLLLQKLLLHQAQLDSIEVNDAQVDQDVERKMQFFLAQMNGNPADLEEYFGKTYLEVKEDLREVSRDNMMADAMRRNITSRVSITPKEVKAYFNALPEDSIPLISEEVEVGHIVVQPKVNEEQKAAVRQSLEEIRQEIINGSSFKTKAILYSQDPGSARKGGELGFVGRGQLVPAFEAVAFNLKKGEISEVVESMYGFHIIELIERRGEMVNVRHILRIPQVTQADRKLAKSRIDSVYYKVKGGALTFEKAAVEYSEDENSSGNSGMIINPQTGTSKFPLNDLDSRMYGIIQDMEVGGYSEVLSEQSPDGSSYYHFVYLKSRKPAHKASLKTDYQKIYEEALLKKQKEYLDHWVEKQIKKTYISVKESYVCDLLSPWMKS